MNDAMRSVPSISTLQISLLATDLPTNMPTGHLQCFDICNVENYVFFTMLLNANWHDCEVSGMIEYVT